MLLHIIRRELLDQMLTLRFSAASILCLVVFLLSSLVLSREYEEAVSDYHSKSSAHHTTIMETDEIQRIGGNVKVARPVNVMNLLVRGLNSDLTESIQIHGDGQLGFAESREQNPVIPLFPHVDYGFVVGIILSLLALAFSYNAISGEQETGTLKVVMSYSVPRDVFLLGKWVGGYLAMIAPFVVSFLVGLSIMFLLPGVEIGSEQGLATVGLLFLGLLYLSAIFSLGILVSCLTRIASTSITVLLLAWVALILAVPSMAPYVTSEFIGSPSRDSIDRELSKIRVEADKTWDRMVREKRKEAGNWEFWGSDEWQATRKEHWGAVRDASQKIEDDYMAQVRELTSVSSLVARLSPLTSFQLSSLNMAGAGVEQETRFVDALKEYSNSWEAYSEGKKEALNKADGEEQSEADDARWALDDYPRFKFDYMDFTDRLSLVYVDVLLLAVWNIVFFMLAYIAFLRYGVHS